MLAIDDLAAGDWVTITQLPEVLVADPVYGFRTAQPRLTGTPLKVLAINLPFVRAIDPEGDIWTLHAHGLGLTRCSAEYVQTYAEKQAAPQLPATKPRACKASPKRATAKKATKKKTR